jgi:hypothetical protein
MTLKNKDGSVYRLAGPNPVMKTQEIWEGFKVHNMQWDGETAKDTNQVAPLTSDFDVRDTFLSALDKAKADIKVSEAKTESTPPQVERKPVVQPDLQREELRASTDSGIEKTFIHCLPAVLRTRKDSLYGDSYTTVQYGKPTSFEGVILNQQDLFIEVWTDTDSINAGSILFPKQGYKRWWRVQGKEQKGGGWVLSATPSDHQPSFDL